MTTTQQTESMVTRAPVKLPRTITGKLAVKTGFDPKDFDSLFVVITGRPGCGKSSLVASNPRAILYDLELNAGSVIDPQATRLELDPNSTTAADDLRASIRGLIASYRSDAALRESVKTVEFDSFDRMVDIFQKDLCRKHNVEDVGDYKGGHGKGYFKVCDELFDLLTQLRLVGLGVVLTSHLGPKDLKSSDGSPVRTITTLCVSGTYRKALVQRRDLMLRVECTQRKIKTKLPSGVEIEQQSKNPNDRQYVVLADTSTTEDDFDSPKTPVPMESGLVLPPKGSWQAVRDAWNRAVDKRRQETQ